MVYIYLAYLISIMNINSIKILLPEIMVDLSVSINWLTWVVNSYTLPLAALIPVAGKIGDLYGPRKFFLAGIFILGAGSLICGTAFSLGWLISGRVIQAVGAALLVPNSLAILMAKTEESERGKVLGLWSGIGASGAVIGPVLSGLLADFVSWRGAFIFLSLLAMLITALAVKKMNVGMEQGKRLKKRKVNFDGPGAVTLMSSTAILLLAITVLPDWGWDDTRVKAAAAAVIVLFYLFYRFEKKAADPLINPLLLKNPRFSLGLLAGFIEQVGISGTLFVLPIYFGTALGYGPARTALLLLPAATVVSLLSPLGGKLSDRFGQGKPIIVGMALRAFSFYMFSRIAMDTSYLYIALGLALNGLGFAMTATPALHSVLSTVDSTRNGVASGVHNMVRFTGSAAGTTIAGIILYALIPSVFEGVTGPLPGFREAFLFGAAACLPGIGAGVYLALLNNRHKVMEEEITG